MDGLSAAASVIAVVQIAEVVCSKLQQYIWAVKDAKKDIERLRDEILTLHDVLEKVDDLKYGPRSEALALDILNKPDGPIEKCNYELVELLSRLDTGQGDTAMKRVGWRALKWPFNRKAVDKILESLEKYKATFNLALTAGSINVAFEINQGIEDLKVEYAATRTDISGTRIDIASIRADMITNQVRKNHDKIIQWLSVVDPSSNHYAACGSHQAKTGEWLINHSTFENWKTRQNSLLWLYGKAGCGKTILSSTIIGHLKSYCNAESSFAVAYFYFDFNDIEKQNVDNCLSSIIAQLCGDVTKLPEELTALYERCSGSAKVAKSDLREIFYLFAIHNELKKVFIVFDALDECLDNEKRKSRTELLELIMEITNLSQSNMHLLVTSRPEYDIKERLTSLVTHSAISIQGSELKSDISLHINSELSTDPKLRKWPDEMKKEIKQALLIKADGMFRWVFCQLNALKKCKNKKALLKALESLPETLDETYMRILRNINKEYQQEARRALLWLAFSKDSLNVREVAEAAVIDPQLPSFDPEDRLCDPTNDILEILGSLITVSPNNSMYEYDSDHEGDMDDVSTHQSRHSLNQNSDNLPSRKIRLAHFSVKEYLVSQRIRDGEASIFGFTDVPANQFMAESCLLYIYHYDESGLKTTSIEDLDHFPLLRYSCQFWYVHTQSIPLDSQKQMGLLMSRLFLSASLLLSWLNVHRPNINMLPFGNSDQIETPLYYASWIGLQTVVHSLLKNKSDVDFKGTDGFTALHAAARRGHGAVSQLLLEHGADINAKNEDGDGTLHLAVKSRSHSTLQILLNHKSNNDIKIVNQTSVMPTRDSIDVDAKNKDEETVLHLAATYGDASIMQLLLIHKPTIRAQDIDGDTALHLAAMYGNASMVQLLLDHNATIDAPNIYGFTALLQAALVGHASIVQLLLDRNANINARNMYGFTALHQAALMRRASIVRLLLARDADATIRNLEGETALDVAVREEAREIVKILEEVRRV